MRFFTNKYPLCYCGKNAVCPISDELMSYFLTGGPAADYPSFLNKANMVVLLSLLPNSYRPKAPLARGDSRTKVQPTVLAKQSALKPMGSG